MHSHQSVTCHTMYRPSCCCFKFAIIVLSSKYDAIQFINRIIIITWGWKRHCERRSMTYFMAHKRSQVCITVLPIVCIWDARSWMFNLFTITWGAEVTISWLLFYQSFISVQFNITHRPALTFTNSKSRGTNVDLDYHLVQGYRLIFKSYTGRSELWGIDFYKPRWTMTVLSWTLQPAVEQWADC